MLAGLRDDLARLLLVVGVVRGDGTNDDHDLGVIEACIQDGSASVAASMVAARTAISLPVANRRPERAPGRGHARRVLGTAPTMPETE